jgi:hypothetical protein
VDKGTRIAHHFLGSLWVAWVAFLASIATICGAIIYVAEKIHTNAPLVIRDIPVVIIISVMIIFVTILFCVAFYSIKVR